MIFVCVFHPIKVRIFSHLPESLKNYESSESKPTGIYTHLLSSFAFWTVLLTEKSCTTISKMKIRRYKFQGPFCNDIV